jgi:Amt family ammonium transporter
MNQINTGDTAFVLICVALVAIMTPGLAFFYGGLVRRKNVITIMMQSFVSLGVVTLVWIICGFSLAFGPDVHGVIGNLHYFFLNNVGQAPNPQYAPTVPFLAFFVFQLTVAALTPALITGAFADRVPFKSYLAFLTAWSLLVYVPLAHWIWGGGFLQQWGVLDFGGGMVVHGSAGFAALASVWVVGKRVFATGEDERPSNIPLIAIGLGLLWFGWLGDNPANAMRANGVAAQALVNTFIAGGLAMLVWMLTDWVRTRKAGMVGALTGVLAGLVAVTPCAGYVPTWAAVVVALAAGGVCYGATQLRAKRGWDDSLDVWGVHGIGGLLGSLLVGLFAYASVGGHNGLLAGNGKQFGLQLVGVVIAVGYAFCMSFVILKVVDLVASVQVSRKVQLKGLDEELHGEAAYGPREADAPAHEFPVSAQESGRGDQKPAPDSPGKNPADGG